MNTNETHIDHSQYTARKLIWGDDDPIDPDNVYVAPNPTIARVKPPKQVSEPIYIDLRDLEAFREIESATYKQATPSNTSGVQEENNYIR